MNNRNKIDVYKEIEKQLQDRKKKTELFYADQTIAIYFDHANHWLLVDWTGYQSETSIMTGGEKMLEGLKLFKASKVLNDNTDVIGIWTPAAKWTGEVWFPAMLEAGLKHFAWINSPNMLSRVSTDEAIKNTDDTGPIRVFDNKEAAVKWLEKCK